MRKIIINIFAFASMSLVGAPTLVIRDGITGNLDDPEYFSNFQAMYHYIALSLGLTPGILGKETVFLYDQIILTSHNLEEKRGILQNIESLELQKIIRDISPVFRSSGNGAINVSWPRLSFISAGFQGLPEGELQTGLAIETICGARMVFMQEIRNIRVDTYRDPFGSIGIKATPEFLANILTPDLSVLQQIKLEMERLHFQTEPGRSLLIGKYGARFAPTTNIPTIADIPLTPEQIEKLQELGVDVEVLRARDAT